MTLLEDFALKDSLNHQRVMAKVDEYDWPEKSLVGKKANMAVFFVIQHAPLKFKRSICLSLGNQ
jgi:hypothetical protein